MNNSKKSNVNKVIEELTNLYKQRETLEQTIKGRERYLKNICNIPDDIPNIEISDIVYFDTKVKHALRRNKVYDLYSLCAKSRKEIRSMRGIGDGLAQIIESVLFNQYKIQLR